MLKQISSFFNSAKNGLNNALKSHSFMEGAFKAVGVIANPKAVSFSCFMDYISDNLSDPDETLGASDDFDSNTLYLINLCAKMSLAVYYESSQRNLPKEAGHVVFEPNLTDISSSAVPFIITNSDELDLIIVCCRGSFCFSDFLTDFNANAVDAFGGLMHSGILKTSISVYAICKDKLIQEVKNNNNRRIVFTGHSLGAAVAATVCAIFKTDFPDAAAKTIIFAPAACISRDLWNKSRDNTISFIMKGDAVPFLSLHNIAQYSSDCLPDIFKSLIDNCVRREVYRPVEEVHIDMSEDPFTKPPPSIEEVKNDMDKEAAFRTTALYPPGELYLFEIMGDMFKTIQLRKAQSCDYFGKLIPGLQDLGNHSISRYAECTEKLYLNQLEREGLTHPDPYT